MTLNLRNTQGGVKSDFAYHAMAAVLASCDLHGMLIRLKEFRGGMTLEDMAERSGFSVSQLSRWESGKNNIPSDRLPALAEAYGCRIGEIFDVITAPTPTIEELARMVGRAMGELPVGVSFADYPNAVAANLREQLKQYQAAGGFQSGRAGETALDKDAQFQKPTRQRVEEESRSQ